MSFVPRRLFPRFPSSRPPIESSSPPRMLGTRTPLPFFRSRLLAILHGNRLIFSDCPTWLTFVVTTYGSIRCSANSGSPQNNCIHYDVLASTKYHSVEHDSDLTVIGAFDVIWPSLDTTAHNPRYFHEDRQSFGFLIVSNN